MKKLLQSKFALGAIAAFVVSTIFGAGIAFASIPGSNGVVSACRNNNNGTLKAIDAEAGQTCSGNEAALSWNQTGPQGPAGQSAANGIEVVSTPIVGSSTTKVTDISCPSGKVATGGGFDGVADYIQASSPVMSSGKPVGWHAQVYGSVSGNVYAVCVNDQ